MIRAGRSLGLSQDRFNVVYHLRGDRAQIDQMAQDITVEQTIEFPADLIDCDDDISQQIVGRIESTEKLSEELWSVVISFAVEVTGFTLPQLINVVFGNISIKPDIRVARLDNLPESLLRHFKGPRFGVSGLRNLVGEAKRALLCTALKPMGLSSKQLAQQAYEFAMGGMDFIKDDHGLSNQSFSPFRERVEQCAQAVARANQKTGFNCRYVPSLSSAYETFLDDAKFAKQCDVGGLLIAPGLVGFDAMRMIADNDSIALPVLGHPSFVGSYAISANNGLSHSVLFGQLMRLAGADTSIFPNYGGRFSFSKDECRAIADTTGSAMAHIKTNLPSPGGGMTLDRVPELLDFYGNDIMLLIGGALHRGTHGLVKTCIEFREMVETNAANN